jgi:signal transduction histidine kinase/CHASE2 domain-containing sensor protein
MASAQGQSAASPVPSPRRSWPQTAGLAVTLFIVVVALSMIPPVRESQVQLSDTYFRLAPPPRKRSQVVLVLVDDQSLQTYGRWPWPRSLLAQLTDRLADAGASVIGLDILLAEPQSPTEDTALSAVFQASGRVVIVDKIAAFPDGPQWVEPLPQFSRVAAVGHAQTVLDRDSICRRSPPQELTLDGPRWAFAIEIARKSDPKGTAAFLARYGIPLSKDTSSITIATPTLIPIPFRHDGFQTLSAAEVLGRASLNAVQGRPVLVGFGPSELGDRVATPLGGALPTPGGEVHAQMLDAILTGRALHEIGFWASTALLLLVCTLVVLIFRRTRGWVGFVWLAFFSVGVYAVGFVAYVILQRMLPAGMLLLAVVLAPLLVYSADFVAVERSITHQLGGLHSWLSTHEAPLPEKNELSWKLQLLQSLQTELGALYELHKALLESTQDLVAIFDERGNLLLKNDAFLAMCPLPSESLTLEQFRRQLSSKEDAPLIENRQVLEGEVYLDSDLYSLRLAPLPPTSISPQGGTILTMASLRTREERDRARAEALGFITHELRTPLTSIQGFAELMMRYPTSPSCATAPETIARESRRLLVLINSYLDILRLDAGAKALQARPLDLDELIKQVFDLLQPLAAASQIRLIHHIGRGPVMAAGDASLIQGAVLNLVSNAIKYGKGGTDILVACTQQERDSVIVVKNQGEPIASADVPHLFDAHYRAPAAERAAPGWGLGLAFVKRIAEKHGGWVAVQSNTSGTTFEMHLPANPVAATPQTV